MTAALRAEWLKLTTTRTFTGLLGGAAAVGVLAAFVGTAQGPPPWNVSQPLHAGTAWSMGTLAVTVLAVVVGSRIVTEEFAHHTIAQTFVADPGRRRSMVAKAVIAALASMLIAAVATAVIAATVYGMAVATAGDRALFMSDGQAVLGLFAAAGAMGAIGVGVGALVRHPVATLVGLLLWLFVAENLLGLLAGPVAGFLPGKLAVALSGVPQAAGGVPGMLIAGAMAAYVVVVAAAGTFEIQRRDVL
jgi:ABC-2 type transport system permease protein